MTDYRTCKEESVVSVVNETAPGIPVTQMRRVMLWQSFLAICILHLLVACDPGYRYRPDGWQAQGDGWKKSVDGIDLDLHDPGVLEGSRTFVISLRLTNRTDEVLVLEKAELVRPGRDTLLAAIPDSSALKWRSVNPAESKLIDFVWHFDLLAVDVLGENPEVVFSLRAGSLSERVEVRFTRVE